MFSVFPRNISNVVTIVFEISIVKTSSKYVTLVKPLVLANSYLGTMAFIGFASLSSF